MVKKMEGRVKERLRRVREMSGGQREIDSDHHVERAIRDLEKMIVAEVIEKHYKA